MIGRFTNLDAYHELLNIKSFIKVGFAGLLGLLGYFFMLKGNVYSSIGLILIVSSIGINGIPIIIDAVKGLIKRKINVDELVSIAIVACIISGEYLTAATVSFVMVLGALIEEATAESARKAIHSLIKINPENANLIEKGKESLIPVLQVKVGDILLVKPGERIPVDATIVKGITAIDESTITGEPIPNEKNVGDSVFAGTLNHNGVIKIRTTKIGSDTTLGKVIKLVLKAETYKPESISIIDKYAKWFTPIILLCAGVVWLITGLPNRAIAVLIVGCPCALILAAPTAIVATISRAAKSGILIKGGQYIEKIGRADVILFDKTGTLSEGEPKVHEVISTEGIQSNYILQQAACVEQNSSHPLARAVLNAARYAKITINAAEDLFTEIGIGVRGIVEGSKVEVGSANLGKGTMKTPKFLQHSINSAKETGKTPLIVYRDSVAIGIINVSDKLRSNAELTVEKLKKMGIKRIGIVSGDHQKSVTITGRIIKATDIWYELKPDEKLSVIRKIQKTGSEVIYVGDGINDAPSLASADVGIAMGGKGTDVALETADIVLMNDDIGKIPFLINISRKMTFIIKWNIAFGLVFNIIAVSASGGGFVTPILGAVIHNIGSVFVVLSSASLIFINDR